MNKIFKKIIIILIIFFNYSLNAEEIEKRIFLISNNSYTTIDFQERILYLKLLTAENITLSNKEIKTDFISVLLFNEFAKKNNIKFSNEILIDYSNKIISTYKKKFPKKFNNIITNFNNYEEIIKKNVKYDYQRKIVIEQKLNNKNIENYKVNEIKLLNINDIEINYFSIDNKNIIDQKEIIKLINFNDIDKTKSILNEKKISFTYNSSIIDSLEKIDKRIKEKIIKNDEKFIILEETYFIIGKIYKTLKKDIDLKYTFFQIDTEDEILFKNLENLKCKDIKNLNKKFQIKEFNSIEIKKLNKIITENLNNVNDKILLNNNNNKTYIILCNLEYNKDIIKEIIFNQKINKVIQEIELELVNEMKNKYNFKEYE